MKATEAVSTFKVQNPLDFCHQETSYMSFCCILVEKHCQELTVQRDGSRVTEFPARVRARETEIAV